MFSTDDTVAPGRRGGLASRIWHTALDRSVMFSFDRIGFERHQRTFDPRDLDVDLSGQVCLVTGANMGIGRATALGLARLGARVYLLCRNEQRGLAARDELRAETGNPDIHLALIDLSRLSSIRSFIADFAETRVDVLVHNAGVCPARRTDSEDGIELTWATHLTGPLALTWQLVPHLRRAPLGRVIVISTGGIYTQKFELGDWQWRQRPYKGLAAYAQTKRGQVILAELLSEHFAGTTLRFNSMHPGWCDTTMVRDSIPRFQRFIGRRLRSHAQGADTAVWLAACQRIADHSGRFWFDRQPQPTHVMSRTVESPDDRARLWSLCTEQCGDLVAPH